MRRISYSGRRSCQTLQFRPSKAAGRSQAPICRPGHKVYVVKVPLVGLEEVGKLLGPAWPHQLKHSMTVVVSADGQCRAYDFLPRDATSPGTLLRMISGSAVPGELRSRPLRGVPSTNSWFVGTTECHNPFEASEEFNRQYDSNIRLFANDCRKHTNELVLHLTDIPEALDNL